MKLKLMVSFFLLAACFTAFSQQKQSMAVVDTSVIRVSLLGTGTPKPSMERFGPSILVRAGSETLLFDAGRGCLQRIAQLNLSYQKINALFLTHLHSDHIVGLPDLWLTGWLTSKRV